MGYSKKTENYTNQTFVNSPSRNCLIVNGYFASQQGRRSCDCPASLLRAGKKVAILCNNSAFYGSL
jgi:hypothetical protein